ncbi:Gfo/Idh/MocA family oxidoreductase [bacterium]|nr:Gfo/Idh/MocA family oxidoreductase [bacterium]
MLQVGLVGYGFMGKMHAQCYQATGQAQVAALVDVEPDRRADARSKFGCEVFESIEEMLASMQVDLIDICTPTYLHETHVISASKAGVPIMCEKPLSLTLDSCDRMIEVVREADVPMMVGQVLRFCNEYVMAKELVDSDRYGKVLWASCSRTSPPADWSWQGWLKDPEKSGGAILDLHIHDVDFLAWLLGTPVDVRARGVRSTMGAVDSVFTTSIHEGNVVSYAQGTLMLSRTSPFNMAFTINLERATIQMDI